MSGRPAQSLTSGAAHLLAALSVLIAAPAAATSAAPRPIPTRITDVTVYADRAQVTRAGSVDLSEGGRVVVAGLPGWIDEESVRVSAAGARIRDVAVERTYLAEASEEAVRKADAAVNEVADALAAIGDEEAVLQAEIAQLEAVRAFSAEKLPRSMAVRDVKISTFAEAVDYVAAELREDRKALRELAKQRRTLLPELQARSATRDALTARAQLEQRSVVVEIEGKGRATLVVTYLTPGATWEPLSELRTKSGTTTASLGQLAQVVQTTGEDWEGAALTFSTQRPAETLVIPEVRSLLLGAAGGGLGEVVGRVSESWGRAASSYAAQNAVFAQNKAELQDNLYRQQEIQTRSTATFDSLAQRGTTAHYAALSPRTVPTDGRPIRVPIGLHDFEVRPRLVAVPEVSLNAVRTAEIVNSGDQPVLPGKVALFVDGAFVGTSELPFVSSGETFTTYLGVNDRVKLERALDRDRSHLERGKHRTELRVSFVISAENLDATPVTLELGDRVPVAQIDSIEIDGVKVPKEASRDGNGIVRWTATLAPKARQSWRIEYQLEYDNDLLVRQAPNRQAAPAKARMLYEDIENLEKRF